MRSRHCAADHGILAACLPGRACDQPLPRRRYKERGGRFLGGGFRQAWHLRQERVRRVRVAMSTSSVQVAVRCRCFIHAYEMDKKTGVPHPHVKKIIRIEPPVTYITNPETGQEKQFTYDFSYDSFDTTADHYASQATVYNDLGTVVLDNAWQGFNVTLFAYGQTGSGKSFSMTGGNTPDSEGIMPRATREIFKRIGENTDPELTYKVEVSMLEVYMEKIHDLFDPSKGGNQGLKLRENPAIGVYVDGLEARLVKDYDEIANWMEVGISNRTKAATEMNADSSRAHTVLEVTITQTRIKKGEKKGQLKVSKINLVDLAGSERLSKTGAKGKTMLEGQKINLSLTTLGRVINALAANSGDGGRKSMVPYRESKLTYLLKNSLGGNSKTIMIAAIAPSSVNYDETLGTLQYASRAKKIQNKAVVNEDAGTKLVNNLKKEIEALKAQLTGGGGSAAGGARDAWEDERAALLAKLKESEHLAQRATMTWEEKERETKAAAEGQGMNELKAQRERAQTTPCLVNMSEDPQMDGRIMHFLEYGKEVTFGRKDGSPQPDVILAGLNIAKVHCAVKADTDNGEGFVLTNPHGSKTYVNGVPVRKGASVALRIHSRVIFGSSNVFRLQIPDGTSGATPRRPDHVTWSHAIEELNQGQMAAFEDQHREEREKAEAMRKEMEEKLREMEHMINMEREKGGTRAAELEAQLEEQRDRAERLARRKAKEAQQRSLMDQQLLKAIGMVEEANSIALELEQGMCFSIKLRVNQSQAVREATEEDFVAEKEVFIKIDFDHGGQPSAMWAYEPKFVNRLYAMRELYQDYVDAGRNLGAVMGPLLPSDNPFVDDATDQSIGKALIYLEPLMYLMDVEERTSIYDFKGKSMGDLSVEIKVFADEACTQRLDNVEMDDGVEDELSMLLNQKIFISVTVEKAQGLPSELSRDVFVKFSFWPEEQCYQVPRCQTKTINPVFNHTKVFGIKVTNDFIQHVQQTALEFDVMGSSGNDFAATASRGGSTSRAAGIGERTGRSAENDEKQRIAELEAELSEMKAKEAEFERFRNVLTSNPESRKHVEQALKTAGMETSAFCTIA